MGECEHRTVVTVGVTGGCTDCGLAIGHVLVQDLLRQRASMRHDLKAARERDTRYREALENIAAYDPDIDEPSVVSPRELARDALSAPPAALDVEAIRGTYECPICGFDKPHTHDRQMLQWFEDAKSNPKYDVEGQRRYARKCAESEWRDSERRREFDEDPVGVLNRGVFKIDEGVKFGDAEYTSGRDLMFHIGPWIQKKLQELLAEIARLRAAATLDGEGLTAEELRALAVYVGPNGHPPNIAAVVEKLRALASKARR